MNLLQKYIKSDKIKNENFTSISEFRKFQYNQINNYIKIAFNFLNKLSNNKIILSGIQTDEIIKYKGINGSDIKKISIFIKDPDDLSKNKLFMAFNIPNIINDNFFYIGGCYYCPALYILDYPIIYKQTSIKLFGLINSMTIFFKYGSARTIFGGRNIPIQYFIQWFLDDSPDLLNRVEDECRINKTKYTEDELIKYFANLLNCDEDKDIINNFLNELFFDSYTSDLYFQCYNKHFTLKSLIHHALTNFINGVNINFVDLQYKRLIFIEQLLYPFFNRISNISFNIIRGQNISGINFPENELIKFFMVELKHQFYYDLVNAYSGITVCKASLLNPNSETAPKEISSIHKSHFGKICPTTISAQKPGETVSIIPGTLFDRYGRFQ